MTHDDAERSLSVLENIARTLSGARSTDVQGRPLAVWYAGNTAMYYYDRSKIDRVAALALLQNS